jgi:hypothetical protein
MKIKPVVGALLAAFPLVAALPVYAAAPTPRYYWIAAGSTHYDSPIEACQAAAGSTYTNVSVVMVSETFGECHGKQNNVDRNWINVARQTEMVCSDGSTPNTTKPLAQQCPESCPPPGTPAGNIDLTLGFGKSQHQDPLDINYNPTSSTYCQSGCLTSVSNVESCESYQDGSWYRYVCTYDLVISGGKCEITQYQPPAAPPAPSPTPAPTPTPASPTPTPTTPTPTPTGGPSPTPTPTPTDGGGGSSPTPTPTPGGGGGGSTPTPTPAGTPTPTPTPDFCKQNPGLNICKNSTVSGSC